MSARLTWPGLVVMLGLTLVPGPALAKDCTREMPLPADARLVPRAADAPDDVARFAGAWLGAWKNRDGSDGLCTALIVEEVFTNGIARVIYSYGVDKAFDAHVPNYRRATGQIADGVLRFVLPGPAPGPLPLAFAFDAGKLNGTYPGEGSAALSRIRDLGDLGCPRPSSVTPPRPSTGAPRERLTADELLAASPPISGLIHNGYFMPIGLSAPSRHALKGVLTIVGSMVTIGSRGCAGPGPMPAFSAAFVTHGEHLVPAVRAILEPPGIVILSPGRVWSEPGDRGMSRASFPFVVISEVTNEAHNGLATFLYDDMRVSALRVQNAQETAAWARFDAWGQVQMTYAPGPISGEDALRAQFAAELARETPIRPWSTLPVPAPLRDAFDGDAAPDDVSASGLVVDGVLYLKDCPTRAGPFPYCRHMRHGVFSVTKSMGAAVALLRLAQRYGDAVFDAKIADHLPVRAAHDGWTRVTFADALNMATGIGDLSPQREPNDIYADESNLQRLNRWIRARTARQKLEIALSYGEYPWGPGEVLRYSSPQTFLLAAAMDAFLKQKEGPDAHLWDMLTREVFEPIGIAHAPVMHTLEADGRRGVPLLTYGLYPTVDDVAKLVTLLQNGGRHDGRQILSAGKVAEALYRTAATGLPTGGKNRFGERRYLLSFWSVPYRTQTDCFFRIPFMAGFGGNVVALLPNGVSVFRFADGETFDLETMIRAGEAVRPFCASTTAATHARRALSASEMVAELPGHTFSRGDVHLFIAPGGVLYQKAKDFVDVGTWRIAEDGALCRTWNMFDAGRARCLDVYRAGETFELQPRDRWTTTVLERRMGNPEGF